MVFEDVKIERFVVGDEARIEKPNFHRNMMIKNEYRNKIDRILFCCFLVPGNKKMNFASTM